MELSEIVASENEFKGADGKVYKLAPLGLKEIGELCIWFQYREYESAKELGCDKEHLKEIYKECKDNPVRFEDAGFMTGICSIEGLARLLHCSMHIAQPEIRLEHMSKIVNTTNINEATDKVLAASGLLADKDGATGEVK